MRWIVLRSDGIRLYARARGDRAFLTMEAIMKIRNVGVWAVLLLAVVAGQGIAATLEVPAAFPTIQAAVDAAVAGDEVLVANGVYREPVTLKSGVTLRGETTEGVLLMNPGPQYALYAVDAVNVLVVGLTLQNDLDTWTLGAYLQNSEVDFQDVTVRGFSNGLFYRGKIYQSADVGAVPALAPVISNCRFEGNGTGLSLNNGVAAVVTGNHFTGNTGSAIANEDFCNGTISGNMIVGNGGGIAAYEDSPVLIEENQIISNATGIATSWRSHAVIRRNIISDSVVNGISTYSLSSPTIQNNLIVNNGGEGVWVFFNFPQIVNNTIVGNGANGVRSEWYAAPSLRNNIIAYNAGWAVYDSADNAAYHPGYLGRASVFYSNMFGNLAGELAANIFDRGGNLFAEPLFRNAADGNYQLNTASPSRDAGDPLAYYNDLDGSRNDQGAFGGPLALPGETLPEEVAEEAQSMVYVLPDIAFKNEADGRKEELELKLDEVITLIRRGETEADPQLQSAFLAEALDKLRNDLMKKCDGHFGGKPGNDWIVTYEAQSSIYPLLVDLVNMVEVMRLR